MTFNYQYNCCGEIFGAYAPARMHVHGQHFDWKVTQRNLYLCTDPECQKRNIGKNTVYASAIKHLKEHFEGVWQQRWDFEQRQIRLANDQLRGPTRNIVRGLLDTFDYEMHSDEPFENWIGDADNEQSQQSEDQSEEESVQHEEQDEDEEELLDELDESEASTEKFIHNVDMFVKMLIDLKKFNEMFKY